MSEVSNNDLLNVLIEMKGDIGGIKATLQSHTKAFEAHVKEDKELAADIDRLRLAGARRAGATGVWSFISGVLGTAVGAAATYFAGGKG